MVIGIDEPNNICQLLFIRSAWGIAKDADIPMLDPLPDVGSSAMPSSATEAEWSARWKQAESTPERVCLDALIAAWNAGLETVVSLPYAGYFAQRISAKHLVVSAATRAHPESYNQALVSPMIATWKP